MELTRSNEDYLEAIRRLILENGSAQVRDIAALMKVKMPSVNSAVRSLEELGLVNYVQYAPVSLTAQGEKLADKVIEKHMALRYFLTKTLAFSPERADEVACQMEHMLTSEEIDKLKDFADQLSQ